MNMRTALVSLLKVLSAERKDISRVLSVLYYSKLITLIHLIRTIEIHILILVWADAGECDANPSYMLSHCKKSCDRYYSVDEEISHVQSIFDLSADDIDGNEFKFSELEGKTTVIVNVASYCGYTESHYRGLVELYDLFKGSNFEILAFPSNQFGGQEPDECPTIKKFARRKGVEFRMMYKIDVNGANTHMVYRYLKSKTNVKSITWNFATYFIVTSDGEILAESQVEPMQLKDLLTDLISHDGEF